MTDAPPCFRAYVPHLMRIALMIDLRALSPQMIIFQLKKKQL